MADAQEELVVARRGALHADSVRMDGRIGSIHGMFTPPPRQRPLQRPPPSATRTPGSCLPPSAPRQPAGAAHSQAEHGAARLWLVLDRRLRMGEGSASGVIRMKLRR